MIDFIENYYERSCDEITQTVATDPQSLIETMDDFLGLLSEQVQIVPEDLPKLKPGELRPVVGNAISDLAAGGIQWGPHVDTSSMKDGDGAKLALDVRSLLLYAHTVAVPNPFVASPAVRGPVGHPRVVVDDEMEPQHFLFGLEYLARLSPLIGNEVVHLVEARPQLTPVLAEDLGVTLEQVIPEVVQELLLQRAFAWSDQTDLYMRARILAERFLRQDLFLAHLSGQRTTRLLSCTAEKVALPAFCAIRTSAANTPADREPWVIDELVRLQIQGAGLIKLADMVAIRDDDSFNIFRKDMANAVVASGALEVQGDLHSRQVVIADEMRAAAERLQRSTRKSVFLSATLGDTVNWAIGATLGGAVAGWKGAVVGVAGLIGKGLTDVVRGGPTRAQRAMRAHYIELSRPLAKPPKRSARHKLLPGR
nr:hypothetical protein [Micromonospora provocatoris]